MVSFRMFPILAAAVTFLCLEHGKTLVSCSAAGTPTKFLNDRRRVNADEAQEIHRLRHSRSLGDRLHVEPLADVPMEEGDPAFAAPEQVHIALAVSESREQYAMTISWATWPETDSHVHWGETQDELNKLAIGNATSYSARHPGRADYTSGFLHSATLKELRPLTKYFYSCGDEALGMSSVRSFVTPPEIGASSVTIGIVADLGQTDDSRATLEAIDSDPSLDLVLLAGDLSYADGNQPRWDSFMRMMDPVASRLPWMVVPGNHEIELGSLGLKPFMAYEHRFRMPAVREAVLSHACGRGGGLDGLLVGKTCGAGRGADEADAAAVAEATRLVALGDASTGQEVGAAVRETAKRIREQVGVVSTEEGNGIGQDQNEDDEEPLEICPSEWSGTYDYGSSFYSFDVGPVHVVGLNPYTATGEMSEQHTWLQKDLEALDRSVTPWVIAMMHCPWYNSNLAHQGERQTLTAMRAMEPLLYKHKTAVVIAGHVHAYERTHPAVDFALKEDGPTYLTVGGAGNREGHADDFYHPSPEWSAFRTGAVYGAGRLVIQNPSEALWEWTSTSDDPPSVHDVKTISNPFTLPSLGEPATYAISNSNGGGKSDEGKRTMGKTGTIRIKSMADRRSHFAR